MKAIQNGCVIFTIGDNYVKDTCCLKNESNSKRIGQLITQVVAMSKIHVV